MYNTSPTYQPYQFQQQQPYTQPPSQMYQQNATNQQYDKTLTYGGGSAILRNGSNSYKPLTHNQTHQTNNLVNITSQNNNKPNTVQNYQQNINGIKQPKFKPLKRTIQPLQTQITDNTDRIRQENNGKQFCSFTKTNPFTYNIDYEDKQKGTGRKWC